MQKYIDLGWHTVPLGGELTRLSDGTKTIPDFEKSWRDKYEKNTNKKATKLGGVITGRCSGIIAIDCDNTNTWNLFRSLDRDNSMVFISKGKGYDAGTLIYQYDNDLPQNFSIQDNNFALDFYSNQGFVYLPTEANKTKVPLANPVAPPPLPLHIKTLLLQLSIEPAPADNTRSNIFTASCLNPLVAQFNKDGKFMPGLFKIITPKDFRKTTQYVTKGYLHPNDVPEGRGSEYLSKISAILGADISVDETMYLETMTNINSLFDNPIQFTRLEKTILDPMLTRKAAINGIPIWQYEESWDAHRLILQSKRQSALEIGFDDDRNLYYVVDEANEKFKVFARDSELVSFIEAASIEHPTKKILKSSMPILNVKAEPANTFGFHEGKDPTARTFNTFRQTPELSILRDPDLYEHKYKEPTATLNYIKTLVPDDEIREYLLSFIKSKLTTFKYSPVILYFLGKHGSGKDLFVQILEQIMGSMTRPSTKEFLEIYNGWVLDTYFVQLDEFGNQLTNIRDKEEALGKIKAITGKPMVRIREMRTDGFEYHHNVTFVMTANKNPLMIEDGDRRVLFISTPNVLADAIWVHTAGGMSSVYERILAETKDFCYYLAKHIKPLSPTDYMRAVDSEDKLVLIADSMHAAQRIGFCLKNGMIKYLEDLAMEFECPEVSLAFKHREIMMSQLYDLYGEMTEHNGDNRTLVKIIKANGIQIKPTSREGNKEYAVILPEVNPFKPDED